MSISEPTQGYADTSRHFSPERLRAYVLGKEDDDSSAEIEQHLGGCDFCRDLLRPEDEDSLVLLLRGIGDTSVGAERPALPAASRRQRRLPGYELLEVLGEGGMGVVWKARQQGLNRLVAIKLLRSAGTASQESLARFRREAESVARLHHSHIVQIYDIGEHDGEPYLALEYVDGGSLDEQLSAGPLPPKQAAALAETLARAMRHAHEQGSFTATSSPPTSYSPTTAHPRSAISAWPSNSKWRRRSREPEPSSARPVTWRPSRPAAARRPLVPPPTSTPWAPSCTKR
jgi:hypothetical protein